MTIVRSPLNFCKVSIFFPFQQQKDHSSSLGIAYVTIKDMYSRRDKDVTLIRHWQETGQLLLLQFHCSHTIQWILF